MQDSKVLFLYLSQVAPIVGVSLEGRIDFAESASQQQRDDATSRLSQWNSMTVEERDALKLQLRRQAFLEKIPENLRPAAIDVLQKVRSGSNLNAAETQAAIRVIFRLLLADGL